jgi:hypothetical protein
MADTDKCALSITLYHQDVHNPLREAVFDGESAQDLAMLGAAKGYLEGLYEEAKPAANLASVIPAFEQMEETIGRIFNPPRKPEVAIVTMGPKGPVTIEGASYEAARAAADLVRPPDSVTLEQAATPADGSLLDVEPGSPI